MMNLKMFNDFIWIKRGQTLPKVLENLSDWSSEILTKREELIRTNNTKGVPSIQLNKF